MSKPLQTLSYSSQFQGSFLICKKSKDYTQFMEHIEINIHAKHMSCIL